MGTASIHEGVRRMRFSSLLERTEAKELTQEEASEMLGVNVRTFQRWAARYEAELGIKRGPLTDQSRDDHTSGCPRTRVPESRSRGVTDRRHRGVRDRPGGLEG